MSNIINLGYIQILNIILPLLITPMVIKTIGLSLFGQISYYLAIHTYVLVFIEFGFAYSGVRLINSYKENLFRTSKIYLSIVLVKLLISLLFSLLFLLYIFLFYEQKNIVFNVIIFVTVVVQGLLPMFFFQGKEDLKTYAKHIAFFKILAYLLIFLLVSKSEDTVTYLLLLLASNILPLLSLNYIIFKRGDVQFVNLKRTELQFVVKSGYSVFLTTFFSRVYSNSTVFLLGFFGNHYFTGIYSGIEKIIFGLRSLYAPITTALFSDSVSKLKENPYKGFIHLTKMYLVFAVPILISLILLFIFSDEVLLFFLGKNNTEIKSIYNFLIFVPFFTFGGSVYFINGMVGLYMDKIQVRLFSILTVIFIIFQIFLIKSKFFNLTSISVLVFEILIFIISFTLVKLKVDSLKKVYE
jgi:polysaccharide transporter, PST family